MSYENSLSNKEMTDNNCKVLCFEDENQHLVALQTREYSLRGDMVK